MSAVLHPDAQADALVRVRGLDRAFEQGVERVFALRRIDLDVRRGDFVSIMGPSGSGKSTLLNVLALHDAGWTGAYSLDGHDVRGLGRKERQRLQRDTIGFVFQSFNLLADLTVAENLEMPSPTATFPGAGARRWWPRRWTASAWWPRGASTPASSPAASSSWWRWRGP